MFPPKKNNKILFLTQAIEKGTMFESEIFHYRILPNSDWINGEKNANKMIGAEVYPRIGQQFGDRMVFIASTDLRNAFETNGDDTTQLARAFVLRCGENKNLVCAISKTFLEQNSEFFCMINQIRK